MKQAIKIKENVYWVGVRDLNVRDFHGELYPVDEGATYNAYLVIDDQITLFDTVEEEFCGECIERIESVLDGRSIDNIIVQHAEPDHSGGFKKIYEKYYGKETFIRVLDQGVCPETKWVEGSNYVDIGFQIDPRTGRIILMGAIDNLVKGAAGQAVQNMNLLFGLPETQGLELVPMFP